MVILSFYNDRIFRPVVEEANSVAPAFSRIFKELILVADNKKPFLRAEKGTVMRKATLDVYAQEIEDLCVVIISDIWHIILILMNKLF